MIDPNEAPAGMVAVPYTTCKACALYAIHTTCGHCDPSVRRDGESVIFVYGISAAIGNQATAAPAPTPSPDTDTKHIPSAGMCAECSRHVPDKCSQLPFSTMAVIRTLPAHKLVVVRCTNFER